VSIPPAVVVVPRGDVQKKTVSGTPSKTNDTCKSEICVPTLFKGPRFLQYFETGFRRFALLQVAA
jgi:hypothetical protein